MKNRIDRLTFLGIGSMLVLALLYAMLGAMGLYRSAHAQIGKHTYIVTTTGDDGPGSLRQALLEANDNPGRDHVVFDLAGCAPTTPCVISLQSPLPVISDSLAITGTGMTSLILDANGSFRGLNIAKTIVQIADLTIQNGHTLARGAGIRNFGLLELRRVRLLNNQAGLEGGGVYDVAGITVVDSLFEGNTAGGVGGGLFAEHSAVLTGTTFISNTAFGSGGGLYSFAAQISQGRFEGNQSRQSGGGIHADQVYMSGTVLANNVAFENGGGLAGFGAMQVVDTTFEGNIALTGNGGGLSMFIILASQPELSNPTGLGQSLTLTDTHFVANRAGADGGGVIVSGPLTVNNSTFISNTADLGGGLFHTWYDALIVNSLFARNDARTGGEALALSPTPSNTVTVALSTIVGAAGSDDAGIGLGGGSLVINNTIIAQHAVGIRNVSGAVNEDYLLFYQNGLTIEGNANSGGHSLEGDPHFVAPQNDDFHLSAASAAIDVGAGVGIFQDFEGHPRPLGSGYDIGFDEADLIDGLAISYAPNPTTTVHLPTTFTATFTSGSDVITMWDFGDGSPLETGNPVPHTFSAPGVYAVTVIATNSAGSVSHVVDVEVVDGGIDPPEQKIYLPVITK